MCVCDVKCQTRAIHRNQVSWVSKGGDESKHSTLDSMHNSTNHIITTTITHRLSMQQPWICGIKSLENESVRESCIPPPLRFLLTSFFLLICSLGSIVRFLSLSLPLSFSFILLKFNFSCLISLVRVLLHCLKIISKGTRNFYFSH